MSNEGYRYFHVNGGQLRDDIFEMQADNDRIDGIWEAWAAKFGGNAVSKGKYCAGIVGNKPDGWVKAGEVSYKTVYRPKAADKEAYAEFGKLPKKIECGDVLHKHGFQLTLVGPGFFITSGACGFLHGQAFVMAPQKDIPVPPDSVELLGWQWEKWRHETKSQGGAP